MTDKNKWAREAGVLMGFVIPSAEFSLAMFRCNEAIKNFIPNAIKNKARIPKPSERGKG